MSLISVPIDMSQYLLFFLLQTHTYMSPKLVLTTNLEKVRKKIKMTGNNWLWQNLYHPVHQNDGQQESLTRKTQTLVWRDSQNWFSRFNLKDRLRSSKDYITQGVCEYKRVYCVPVHKCVWFALKLKLIWAALFEVGDCFGKLSVVVVWS